MKRLCFLSHFVICLACAALAFFAYQNGVFQTIYSVDASMMTSIIAALFVGSAIWLGCEAWKADREWPHSGHHPADAAFGHLAVLLAPAFGMLGTAIGLSLQAKSLASGATSFVALATSLYSTGCGIAAFIVIAVMTFNLERGISRART